MEKSKKSRIMEKYCLSGDDTVLMVIDIQERLIPAIKYGEQVIHNTNILISLAQKMGIPIIVTEQYSKGLSKTVSELSDNLAGASTFEKNTFTGCTPEVLASLQGLGRKRSSLPGWDLMSVYCKRSGTC